MFINFTPQVGSLPKFSQTKNALFETLQNISNYLLKAMLTAGIRGQGSFLLPCTYNVTGFPSFFESLGVYLPGELQGCRQLNDVLIKQKNTS